MGEKITRVERTTTSASTQPAVTPTEQTTTTTTSTTTEATSTQPKSVNVNVTEGTQGATSVNIPAAAPDETTNVNING
jgi:hypothetical protein